jgi:hypothetical protein
MPKIFESQNLFVNLSFALHKPKSSCVFVLQKQITCIYEDRFFFVFLDVITSQPSLPNCGAPTLHWYC